MTRKQRPAPSPPRSPAASAPNPITTFGPGKKITHPCDLIGLPKTLLLLAPVESKPKVLNGGDLIEDILGSNILEEAKPTVARHGSASKRPAPPLPSSSMSGGCRCPKFIQGTDSNPIPSRQEVENSDYNKEKLDIADPEQPPLGLRVSNRLVEEHSWDSSDMSDIGPRSSPQGQTWPRGQTADSAMAADQPSGDCHEGHDLSPCSPQPEAAETECGCIRSGSSGSPSSARSACSSLLTVTTEDDGVSIHPDLWAVTTPTCPTPPPPLPPLNLDVDVHSIRPEELRRSRLRTPLARSSSRLEEIRSVLGTLRRVREHVRAERQHSSESKHPLHIEHDVLHFHVNEGLVAPSPGPADRPGGKAGPPPDLDADWAGVATSVLDDSFPGWWPFWRRPPGPGGSGSPSSFSYLADEGCGGSRPSDDDVGVQEDHQDQCQTIRSHRGTVRGVRNRVRAGIATFLLKNQLDTKLKDLAERERGKVVVYITTLGVVRPLMARCVRVRQIFRNLLIQVEECDIFMSKQHQRELRERMERVVRGRVSSSGTGDASEEPPPPPPEPCWTVPQVFVEGCYFGDAEVIERLNESGELRQILKPFKNLNVRNVCQVCGGFGLLPCPSCNGSKKSLLRNDFTEKFVALRCTNCDESALVRCQACRA